jgi:hypothetical protein
LILTCGILAGKPKDSAIYQDTIKKAIKLYGVTHDSSAADGGFASAGNIGYSKKAGMANRVVRKLQFLNNFHLKSIFARL